MLGIVLFSPIILTALWSVYKTKLWKTIKTNVRTMKNEDNLS